MIYFIINAGIAGCGIMSAIRGLSYLRQVDQTQKAAAKSVQKIASGSQYPSAADGASAYSILVKMYSNIVTANFQCPTLARIFCP